MDSSGINKKRHITQANVKACPKCAISPFTGLFEDKLFEDKLFEDKFFEDKVYWG